LSRKPVDCNEQEEFGQRWFVLADLEGNEICVAKDLIG